MATFYLRFEGVNLAHFVEDCKDLNTIRGGSLVLLDAADQKLTDDLALGLKRVASGASAGWYSFEAADEGVAQSVIDVVRDRLRAGPLAHATIVLDAIAATGSANFERDREALWALNRYRQMASPTVVYPQEQSNPQKTSQSFVCELDGVRPATEERSIGNRRRWVSKSIGDRRDYGRKEKQKFYERVNSGARRRLDLPKFAQSFEDIADDGEDSGEGNLNRKLAVIYVDGNRFGAVQASCRSEEEFRNWDTYIRESRLDWLHHHLEETIAPSSRRWYRTVEGESRHRMEILLWGGDDLIVVVPAWQGWSTLERFFEKMRGLDFNGLQTHSAGLVFCHQKASIHTITPLAKRLCEEAKDASKRVANSFSYQVLESFDTLGSDFADQRKTRTPLGSSLDLTVAKMGLLTRRMSEIQRFIPRRKLHEVTRLYLERNAGASGLAQELDRALLAFGEGWKQLREVCGLRDGLPDPACWVHLNELWDYLPGGHQ